MGKSLQQVNAMRQPVNNQTVAAVTPTPAPNEAVTAESLGWQLRAALPSMRLHSVSLWDDQTNTLWLSEGALGPDEHNVVLEASEALANDSSLQCYETGLEDGRVALFLPVRSPQGGLVALAMVLADIKSVNDGVLDKMVTPQIRGILQKVAVLLRPAQPRSTPGESTAKVLALAPDMPAAVPTARAAAPVIAAAPKAPPALSAQAIDDILEFELTPDVAKPVTVPAPASASAPSTPKSVASSGPKPVASAAPKSVGSSSASTPVAAPAPAAISIPIAKAASASPASIASFDDDLRLPTLDTAPAPAAVSAPTLSAAPTLTTAPTLAPAPTPAAIAADSPASALAADLELPDSPASVAPPSATGPASAAVVIPTAVAASALTVSETLATTPSPTEATADTAAPANTSATSSSKALGVSATSTSKALGSAADAPKAASATTTSRVLAMPEGTSLILEVQPFSKLRSGGRMRRYEVLSRSSQPNRTPTGLDKIALQQLLGWMSAHRAAWSLEPTSFTLNLSIATLEDDRFPQFVAQNLKTHGIAPDNIGFEIAEPLCLQRRAQVERFMSLCDKLGCFVVIDDFSLDSQITSLLRSKALRLVKIDPRLTSVAMKDKLSQAMVVAIAQAVKVLGIHCAAKRVDSQAALQWLTGIGCDFAQGSALAQLQPLESLAATPAPTPTGA
jgi:EAL domain-containing protein (putative c-di-GMP-specific phosphodiesterase class I)